MKNHSSTSLYICSQTATTIHLVLAVFASAVFAVSVIGNTISITVILTSRKLRRKVSYLLLVSLATADLCVSLFVTTLKVDMYKENDSFCHNFSSCVFLHITDSLFPIASITHLFCISVDRWYAITQPFDYVSVVTPTRARPVIAAVWCYAVFWTSLGIFQWESPDHTSYRLQSVGKERVCFSDNKYYHTTLVLTIFVLPMTLTTCVYALILRVALTHASAVPKAHQIKMKSETKSAKTVAIVFFAYTGCWLPHFVIVLLHYWRVDALQVFYRTSPRGYDVITSLLSCVLPVLNSCLNPFIYFLSSDAFRVASRDLFRKLLKKSRKDSCGYREEIEMRRTKFSITNCDFLLLPDKEMGTPAMKRAAVKTM